MTTGLNYKVQAQSEALAEAGVERGRDAVRSAASDACGFTKWTDPGGSSSYGCGSRAAKLLFNGVNLGPGDYSAVIDNDCSPLVPASIQDASCTGGSPARDTNETAIMTAWATAGSGQGRARVRAVVGVDNPWKHVCSNSSQDNSARLLQRACEPEREPHPSCRRTRTSTPGGPAAYDDLPRPQLGCSAIDPRVHGATVRRARSCPTRTTTAILTRAGTGWWSRGTGARRTATGAGSIPGLLRLRAEHTLRSRSLFQRHLRRPLDAEGLREERWTRGRTTDSQLQRVESSAAATPTRGWCSGRPSVLGQGLHSTRQRRRGLCHARDGSILDGHRLLWLHHSEPEPPRNRRRGGQRPVRVWGQPGHLAQERLENLDTAATIRVSVGLPLVRSGRRREPRAAADRQSPQPARDLRGYGQRLRHPDPRASSTPAAMSSSIPSSWTAVSWPSRSRPSPPRRPTPTTRPTAMSAPPPGFPEGSGNTVVLVRKSFIVCADYAADTGGGSPCR